MFKKTYAVCIQFPKDVYQKWIKKKLSHEGNSSTFKAELNASTET